MLPFQFPILITWGNILWKWKLRLRCSVLWLYDVVNAVCAFLFLLSNVNRFNSNTFRWCECDEQPNLYTLVIFVFPKELFAVSTAIIRHKNSEFNEFSSSTEMSMLGCGVSLKPRNNHTRQRCCLFLPFWKRKWERDKTNLQTQQQKNLEMFNSCASSDDNLCC